MKPEKRKQRLQQLLDNLAKGKDVPARDMKNILDETEYANYQVDLEMRNYLPSSEKPKAIKKYEELLRNAIFAHSKMDQYSQRPTRKIPAAFNLSIQVDKTFERCLEHLKEMLSMDSSLCQWLDRHLNYHDPEESPVCVEGLPRVKTSRSRENLKRRVGRVTIRDVKVAAIESALRAIDAPETDYDENEDALEAIEKLKPKKVKPEIDTSDWKF